MLVHSYDAASLVLEDAADRFRNAWRLDRDAMHSLEPYFREYLDLVIADCGCTEMDAEVDEENLVLTISLYAEEITMEYGRTHPLFQVIPHTSAFGFRNAGKDKICIYFCFDGLFIRK